MVLDECSGRACSGAGRGWRAGRGRSTILRIVCAAVVLAGCAHGKSSRNPSLSLAYYRLGEDYYSKKRPDAAKDELLRALRYDAENQQAHYLLGVILFVEAVHALNFIDHGQCLRGVAAAEQRQTAETSMRDAERHLRRSVELLRRAGRPSSEALNYLANIAVQFKQYDRAVGLCSKALESPLYAGQYLALGNRGWAFFQMGDLQKAGRDLRQALFHQPAFCLGRFRLGKVYFEQKRYTDAIEELKKVTTDEKCPLQDANHLLGLAYLKQGQRKRAREQFEACVERDPKSCAAFECRRYAKLI